MDPIFTYTFNYLTLNSLLPPFDKNSNERNI